MTETALPDIELNAAGLAIWDRREEAIAHARHFDHVRGIGKLAQRAAVADLQFLGRKPCQRLPELRGRRTSRAAGAQLRRVSVAGTR